MSLFDIHLVSNTLYLCACFLFPLDTTWWICLLVWYSSRETKHGLLCRLDSTTHPSYAVLSEACPKLICAPKLICVLVYAPPKLCAKI